MLLSRFSKPSLLLGRDYVRLTIASEIVDCARLDVRQQAIDPSTGLPSTVTSIWVAYPPISPPVAGKTTVSRMMRLKCQGQLVDLILAVDIPGGLPRSLHRREQYRHENADHSNYGQKLNEREGSAQQFRSTKSASRKRQATTHGCLRRDASGWYVANC
jgi:hypothetical protein